MPDDRVRAEAPAPASRPDAPQYQVTLWPKRWVSARGLRGMVVGSALVYAIPLLAFLGSPALWVILPIMVLHIWALWYCMRRSTRDGRLTETVSLWPDLMTVERREPGGRVRHWQANPYWVRLIMHDDARIESYLTLKGGDREIELGAFLSPEERVSLKAEIEDALARSYAVS